MHLDMLSEEQQAAALKEVDIMSTLSHPNIIKMVECFSTKKNGKVTKLLIVMEYAEGGDLSKREATDLTENEIVDIFAQTCFAVEYCHRQNVVHRDLKPQNIFMAASDRIKLGDFGMSEMLEDSNATTPMHVGTPLYFSPEMVTEQPCGTKADMWSLGVILYHLLMHRHPFAGKSLEDVMVKIAKGEYESLPDRLSPALRDLVDSLLTRDAARRPSASEVFVL
jgi:NIMA (never in mitosis gene a)-related kinase